MYSMWNNSFYVIELTWKNESSKYSPMAFHTSDRGMVTKFKIEELDSLTSVYKDEQNFYNQLLKYGNTYIKEKNSSIIITHTKNGKLYQDIPIYNDKMIRDMSHEIRIKKGQKKSKNRILLSNSEVLLKFIDYIKGLVLDDNAYNYLLNPDFISKDISLDDKKALYTLIKDDVINTDGKVVAKGLRSLLNEYRVDYNAYKECIKNDESTLDISNDISKLEEKINYVIRSDYRTLRNLVAWENKYLEILKKQKNMTDSKREYTICSDLIQEVEMQKKYRNGEIPLEVLEMFYQDRDAITEYIEYKDKVINDEEMLFYYQQGGIDEVMKNISIDEIYGNESKYQDAVKLGIVSKRK